MRDYGIEDTSYIADAYDWIYDAMKTILPHEALIPQIQKDAAVENYRVKIPCSIEALEGIRYNGCWLDRDQDVPVYKNEQPYQNNSWFTVNPPYFEFPFEEGTVDIYFKDFLRSETGHLLVPNQEPIKKGITLYVLRQMMMAGFVHHTLSLGDVVQIASRAIAIAENEALMPDPIQADYILRKFNAMVVIDPSWNYKN